MLYLTRNVLYAGTACAEKHCRAEKTCTAEKGCPAGRACIARTCTAEKSGHSGKMAFSVESTSIMSLSSIAAPACAAPWAAAGNRQATGGQQTGSWSGSATGTSSRGQADPWPSSQPAAYPLQQCWPTFRHMLLSLPASPAARMPCHCSNAAASLTTHPPVAVTPSLTQPTH